MTYIAIEATIIRHMCVRVLPAHLADDLADGLSAWVVGHQRDEIDHDLNDQIYLH